MRTALYALIALIILAWLIFATGLPSMHQPQDEVYMRFSGGRLSPWESLSDASSMHWPYAWASVAAYQGSDDPARKPLEASTDCPEPHAYLSANGWELWDELPLLRHGGPNESDASKAMRKVHLRAEVWSSKSEHKVVVAFGGTVATNLRDWESNLRWLLGAGHSTDEYTVLTDVFVPAFAEAWHKRVGLPGNEWLRTAPVISTGHSLGAGLAERFAYSLNPGFGVPVVKDVYAFDPSPVSGKRSVDDWREQANGLHIYRIYNRGEILASIRSIFMIAHPLPEGEGQRWIDIRYRDNWTWRTLLPVGSVNAHGMRNLSCFMKQAMDGKVKAE